jgi:hypothetical protein
LIAYNTLTDTTAQAARIKQPLMYNGMTMYGNNVLACGGANDTTPFDMNTFDTCELYTPANNTWNTCPSMPTSRLPWRDTIINYFYLPYASVWFVFSAVRTQKNTLSLLQ